MEGSNPGKRGLAREVNKDLIAFLQETTVHGFRYLVDGRNILEKLAWACAIMFGFCFCLSIFIDAWDVWDNDPVETTIDELGLPVTELDFPAITICDTESLKMPRKNRWMFIETLLNSLELRNPQEELKKMYPGNERCVV